VSRLLSVDLRLMGKEVPNWPFFCSTCCDGDEIDVATADGIWLGYLRRLLIEYYTTYSKKCNSSSDLLASASQLSSDWVRRFVRLALTEPGATISVTLDQRKAAAIALSVLLPGAMPQSFMGSLPHDQKASAGAVHRMISVVRELERACVQLFKGGLGAMTKFIASQQSSNSPLPTDAVEREIVASLSEWLAARPAGTGPAAVAGPPVAAVAAAEAGAAAAAAAAAAAEAADAAVAAAANGDAAPIGGAPAQDPAAAAAAAVAAAGGRRPQPTSAYDVVASAVRALGPTVAHDIVSFCVAVVSDPVVSAFNVEHVSGLRGLSQLLRSPSLSTDLPIVLSEVVKNGAVCPTFPRHRLSEDMVLLLKRLRMGVAFLNAVKRMGGSGNAVAVATADCVDQMAACLLSYHAEQPLVADSAAAFGSMWSGAGLTREQMRAFFLSVFPDANDDPLVTGMYFPGRLQFRASAFQCAEKADLGVCSKNYQDARKSFSPGAFIICCAFSHPKMLDFIVLDKREGPQALLDAIITRFATLPRIIVYDFGCGAVRSALGKLPWLLAVSTVVRDAFHIINHVCSKFSASFTILKHTNKVAHEQRNRAIKALKRLLSACGPVEYTSILSYHMLVQNIRAAPRDACTTSLPEAFDFSPFYFSRVPCACGCGQMDDNPFPVDEDE